MPLFPNEPNPKLSWRAKNNVSNGNNGFVNIGCPYPGSNYMLNAPQQQTQSSSYTGYIQGMNPMGAFAPIGQTFIHNNITGQTVYHNK